MQAPSQMGGLFMTGRAEKSLMYNADRLCARVTGVKVGN